MIIKNAEVLTFDNGGMFQKRDIGIEDGLFSESADGGAVDCTGLTAIPGLIDLHLHGCAGYDLCDGSAASIFGMSEYLAANGVTAFNPATMTLPPDRLLDICRAAYDYHKAQQNGEYGASSIFTGITMEGPFLNPNRRGAQNAEYMTAPGIGLLEDMQAASGGLIKIVCVAPELPGAAGFISAASKSCVVSLAHTAADYDTAWAAFRSGASHVTHLFNGMPPFLHREPGVIGAAYDGGAKVEIICDGVHLHPAAARVAIALFGDERCTMISDSMMAAGLGDGEYTLGTNTVTVSGGRALLPDGTIAGSTSNLMDCLKCAVSFGIPLASAARMCSLNPAKILGVDSMMGSITPGRYANLVLLDSGLEIRAVYIKGREVHGNNANLNKNGRKDIQDK